MISFFYVLLTFVVKIANSFQKVLDEYNRKPNKIWIDKCNEF